jgi:hypothetical protein
MHKQKKTRKRRANTLIGITVRTTENKKKKTKSLKKKSKERRNQEKQRRNHLDQYDHRLIFSSAGL